MGQQVAVLVDRTALDRHVVPQRCDRLIQAGRAINDQQFGRCQAPGHQVIQESAPGCLAFATHVAQGEQHLLAVAANAQRHQHREAGRLPVEANPDDRAVEDQADDVVSGKIALLPSLPVGLHLVPGPAHHVLANGTAEQRAECPAHPPGVGAGKIGAGDQRLGSPGEPLVGRKRLVTPLQRLGVRLNQPRPRHRHRDRPKGADQLPFSMAVAMTASGAAPIVAAALQNRRQLGLEQLLDEPANAATNRRLQRIKLILAQKWPRCGRCDSLFHGVISWRLAGRLLGCFPISRLRRLQFLPTLRHDRGAVHAKYKCQCFPQFKNVSALRVGRRAGAEPPAQRSARPAPAVRRPETASAFFSERASACSARRKAQPTLNRRASR